MADIYDWSVIAADNDDADAAINWMEGQFPDTVNNSARQMMARVAEWIKDQGILTASGAANAIAVATTNTARTTPVNGMAITFKAALSNTGASTLAINGGGAIALRKIYTGDTEASSLDAGDVTAQGVYVARYDSGANAGAGAWILINPANQVEVQNLVNTAINTALSNATVKTTPVDNDAVIITDSADSGKTKRTLWSSIKSTLKAYFDTIYQAQLGFTPIRQGYSTSTVTIGWSSGLQVTVDATNFGNTWPVSISGDAASVGGWSIAAINSNIDGRIIRDQASHAGFLGGDATRPYMRVGTSGSGAIVEVARRVDIPNVQASIAATPIAAVGSYAMLRTVSTSGVNPGDTWNGADLYYANGGGAGALGVGSGVWRCMGAAASGSAANNSTLWLRIA